MKQASGSISMNKGSGGDGIPADLFLLHQFLEITLLLSVLINVTTPDTPFKWNHRIFVRFISLRRMSSCGSFML